MPGPGRYEEFRRNDSPKWSMRPKVSQDRKNFLSAVFTKTTQLIVPAPCTYENIEEIGRNPEGKYHVSKYPNSRAKIFNPPRSRRFNKSSKFPMIQPLMSLVLECTSPKTSYRARENTSSPRMSVQASGPSWTAAGNPSLSSSLNVQEVSQHSPSAWSGQLPFPFGLRPLWQQTRQRNAAIKEPNDDEIQAHREIRPNRSNRP